MGLGRRTPLARLLVAFSLTLLWQFELAAQQAPPAQAPAQTPPPVPPAPGLPAPGDVPPSAPPATETPEPPEVQPDLTVPDPAPPSAADADVQADVSADAALSAAAPVEELVVEEAAAAPEGGDMVVTGSRIRRSPELARSAPVEILDRKQLERTGATNAADIVAQLSAAQGSGYQGAGSPLNQGGGAVGTVLVNLRGLGPGATLVLVNGRRLVPTGGGGGTETFSDLAVIPLAAIERVEVLKGGGSAIYGADAVAGVVNVITRNSWDGVRFESDIQSTTRWDQRDLTLSAAWGARSERGRLSIASSYMLRGPLTSDKREFGRIANVDQNGFPPTVILPGFDPANPMRTRFADPGCSMVEGSMIRNPIVNGMMLPDEICTFNYSRFNSILPRLERGNIFASAEYDLSNHTSFFGEFLVNRTRSENVTSPTYSVPPPFLVVPANHVDNPYGRPAQLLGRPLGAAFGGRPNAYGDDTYRAVVGLRGDLEDAARGTVLESWEWELTSSWAISRNVSLVPDTIRRNLQDALNSCSDPSDLSRCFNPFYSSLDGTGTPNSQTVIDRFLGTQTNVTEHSLQTYTANLSGGLFDLPGGEAGFAVGGELRHEWRSSQLDHDANQFAYTFVLGNTDAYADRNIYSGFVELRWPFFSGVELHTAARVEHYTDIEDTTPSPFAGLTLVPSEILGKENVSPIFHKFQLTGQLTWAFHAPSLYQAYPGAGTVPTSLPIPGSPVPVFLPVQYFGNPALEPETALVISAGFNWQPINELTLLAEYWDYNYKNRIAVESSQQALLNDLSLMEMMMPGDPRVIRDPESGTIQRIEVRQRNIDGTVRTNGIDFSGTVTLTGATFGGNPNDWGAVSLGVQGSLTLSYTYPAALAARRAIPNTSPAMTLPPLNCDSEECEAVGKRNYQTFAPPLPRWKLNIPVGWTMAGHSVTLIGHYISGIADDNAVQPDGTLGNLDAMFTLDAQYAFAIPDWFGDELKLSVGFYNVFDTLPQQTRDLNGFETMLYDPRGRMVYAKLSSTF